MLQRWSHGQVSNVPGQAQLITTEYSADSRNRTYWARINLRIHKPKPQARVKEKMIDTHRPCQYNTENMGTTSQGSRDGNVTTATDKTHNPALQRGF